jgi:Glycoside hydrolase family 44
MRWSILSLACLVLSTSAYAVDVDLTIDASGPGEAISPYIFGANHEFQGLKDATIRRFGGNSSETYNWENNFNNSGSDYKQANTDWIARYVAADQKSVPAAAIIQFHDESIRRGVPSIITVPLAGYVAADKDGPVTPDQKPPSSRWKKVVAAKNAPFSDQPDLKDDVVYVDEMVHYLVKKYGPSSSRTGIQFYALGNEPDLWHGTHPLIHPTPPLLREFTARSIEMARAIKKADPSARIIGPSSWHIFGAASFGNAPDWPEVQKQGNYTYATDYYLDEFRKASEKDGVRLLDVFSIHTYATDDALKEGGQRAMIQQVRTLWAEGYREPSWVGEVVAQYLPVFPKVRASINRYYPGTLLATTEYDRGLVDQVFGGLALADTYGAFINQKLYIATAWPLTGFDGEQPAPFAVAAHNLFRNYDGKGDQFGEMCLPSKVSDDVISSAYASLDKAGQLHLILLNKNFHDANNFKAHLTGPKTYRSARIYGFDEDHPGLFEWEPVRQINDGQFTYSLKRRSAIHLVFSEQALPADYKVSPPPEPKAAQAPAAAPAPAPAAAAAPLASWEDVMDGWQPNVGEGQPMTRGTAFSSDHATAGTKSLAIQLRDGFRPALRHEDAKFASIIKGHKLALDVTAPEGTASPYLQMSAAGVAGGMEWQQTPLVDIVADGKPHTIILDASAWPVPQDSPYLILWLVTNTQEGTQPGTIYIDNLRIAD